MICAFCGEHPATHLDSDGRPECARCEALVADPVETLGFGIDDETFGRMTVQ